jgi:ABC-type antimicrobial peptide transport system permease subunit
MLGIIIGVGAVIVMVAIGQGAKGQIQERINNLGTNMIVITPGASNTGGASMGAGSSNRLTLAEFELLKRNSVVLTASSPVLTTFSQLIGGTGNWRSLVNGVSTDYFTIRDWDVSSGRVFDVAVDLRLGSPTFAQWVGVELSAENFQQLLVPAGFGHGFAVLSEAAELQYRCTNVYRPETEGAISWDDPDIGIEWPLDNPILSARDQQAMSMAQYREQPAFRYE